jgi:hypothetical protein
VRSFGAVFPSENSSILSRKSASRCECSAEIARADFVAEPLQVVARKNPRHNPSNPRQFGPSKKSRRVLQKKIDAESSQSDSLATSSVATNFRALPGA